MKTTKQLTWTITWETVDGRVKISKFRAATLSEAIQMTCEEYTVGNILTVHQRDTRWM